MPFHPISLYRRADANLTRIVAALSIATSRCYSIRYFPHCGMLVEHRKYNSSQNAFSIVSLPGRLWTQHPINQCLLTTKNKHLFIFVVDRHPGNYETKCTTESRIFLSVPLSCLRFRDHRIALFQYPALSQLNEGSDLCPQCRAISELCLGFHRYALHIFPREPLVAVGIADIPPFLS